MKKIRRRKNTRVLLFPGRADVSNNLTLLRLSCLIRTMPKVDIELVRMVLQRAEINAGKIAQILDDIKFESMENAKKEDREPPVKKQFVVILSDPYGKVAATGFEYAAWVVQIPEDENPASALGRIHEGAYDFNVSPKGRKMPLKTVAEACEFGSAKINKEHKLWIKTKEPVLVVTTSGKIPRESGTKE